MTKKMMIGAVVLSLTTVMAGYKTKTESHYENKDRGGTLKGLATRALKGKAAHQQWADQKRQVNNEGGEKRRQMFEKIRSDPRLAELLQVVQRYTTAHHKDELQPAYDEIVQILNRLKAHAGMGEKFMQRPLYPQDGRAGMFGESQSGFQKLQKMFWDLRDKGCTFSIRTDSHFPGMLVASCGKGALKKDQVLDGKSLFGRLKTPSKIAQMRHDRKNRSAVAQ